VRGTNTQTSTMERMGARKCLYAQTMEIRWG
jgi:hypothetical protein